MLGIRKKSKQSQDIDLFENLYQHYYAKTLYFAKQYLSNQDEAEEVAQETFITLWQQRGNIKKELSVQSFILTIAKNKCLNILRKRIIGRKYYDDVSLRETAANISALSDESIEQIHFTELQQLIQEAFNELPSKTQMVYQMNRDQQMTYEEIAQILQVSIKTIEYHMTKALAHFRYRLKDYLPISILYLMYLLSDELIDCTLF